MNRLTLLAIVLLAGCAHSPIVAPAPDTKIISCSQAPQWWENDPKTGKRIVEVFVCFRSDGVLTFRSAVPAPEVAVPAPTAVKVDHSMDKLAEKSVPKAKKRR